MIILIGSLRFSIVSSKVLLSRYHVKKLYLLARLKVRFFFQYCSIRTIFYRFQLLPIIVVQLGKEKEPGKSSDEKYIKVAMAIFKFKGINCGDSSALRPNLLIVLVVFPLNCPDYCKTFPRLFRQLYFPSPPFTCPFMRS